jgi:hypothetical protein
MEWQIFTVGLVDRLLTKCDASTNYAKYVFWSMLTSLGLVVWCKPVIRNPLNVNADHSKISHYGIWASLATR